jgi:hypothetical protein
MDERFARARTFIWTQGRLLERRLFGVLFEGAPAADVGRVVAAYGNPDGGLGHGLEPDFRCAESQPLFVEFGLAALHDAGFRDRSMALSLCAFLESVSGPDGLVPFLLPSAFASAHASHMREPGPPAFNPTAGICGLLLSQGVAHPWLARATETCLRVIREAPPKEAHALVCASRLVDALPDRSVAEQARMRIAAALEGASFFIPWAPVRGYGLTPLHFARTPGSPWRALFADAQIEGHLDDLAGMQQEDGGWPITWESSCPAAVCEWRAKWTLDAIAVLAAYGRIEATNETT